MENKKYHLYIDLINIMLQFLIAFSLIGMFLLLTTNDPKLVLLITVLLPAPFLSYLISKYTKHIWSFLLLHVMISAVYILANRNPFVLTSYTLYILILTITNLKGKIQIEKEQKGNTSMYLIIIFMLLYLLCDYLAITALNPYILSFVIIYVLLYFLNMYLINFERFFQNHSNIANVPIHQIRNTNNALILFFGGFCLAVMILFINFPLGKLLSYLGNLVVTILKAFFSLFKRSNVEEVIPNKPEINMGQNDTPLLLEPNEASPIWEFIQNLIAGILFLIIVAGIIALIVFSLYKLYKLFYNSKINNFRDRTEFISPFDKKEKVKSGLFPSPFKKRSAKFGGSSNDKIRKLFYKGVLSHPDSGQLSKSLTPSQLSKYALTNNKGLLKTKVDSDKAVNLTAYYEKARYSGKECTKEDVKKVKNILR